MNHEMISHDGPGHRWLAERSAAGMKLGLDRMHALLAALGHPEQATPTVVVAGTNGKGSTSAMLAGLLHTAGVRVGHFTSPHLVQTRERFRLGDRCVSAELLDEALVEIRDASGDLGPTPFEVLAAAAFVIFRKQKAEIAVMEVGLGGRLDATNVTTPLLAVVTQIARDHTRVLGDTLAEIAREKVAIARPGRPLIVAQPTVTIGAARRLGLDCPIRKVGTDVLVTEVDVSGKAFGTSAVLRGPALPGPLHVEVALNGAHQVENAATAVLAYAELLKVWDRALPPLDEVAWYLAEVPWPARLEVISKDPTVVIDGAHNPAGMRALVSALEARGNRWQVVLSVRDNRDPEELIRLLAPITDTFWLPRMESTRLHKATDLAAAVDACAPLASNAVGSSKGCFQHAMREASPSSGVVATGSLYALGEWLGSGALRSPRLERWIGGMD
ncbi:MAG: hypothetical protein KC502_13800 [Myxococcales bacterium]|nr:hypothetical protein [Myxococcales bacterium]